MLDLSGNSAMTAMCIAALLTEDHVLCDPLTGQITLTRNEDDSSEGGVCIALDALCDFEGSQEGATGNTLRAEYRNQAKTTAALAGIRGHLRRLSESAELRDRIAIIDAQIAALDEFLRGLEACIAIETPVRSDVADMIRADCERLGRAMFVPLLELLQSIDPTTSQYVVDKMPAPSLFTSAAE